MVLQWTNYSGRNLFASCLTVLYFFHMFCIFIMFSYSHLYYTIFFCRSLIFPFLIRGGKATPLSPFLAAVAFCLFNGFMQGFYFVNYCKYEDYWLSDMRFVLGNAFFSQFVLVLCQFVTYFVSFFFSQSQSKITQQVAKIYGLKWV